MGEYSFSLDDLDWIARRADRISTVAIVLALVGAIVAIAIADAGQGQVAIILASASALGLLVARRTTHRLYAKASSSRQRFLRASAQAIAANATTPTSRREAERVLASLAGEIESTAAVAEILGLSQHSPLAAIVEALRSTGLVRDVEVTDAAQGEQVRMTIEPAAGVTKQDLETVLVKLVEIGFGEPPTRES